MASDSMTLDAVLATLSAQANLDGRGPEILAAAITLRDSPGHQTLRAMCRVWCVQRQERVSGKWKDRSVATLHGLLTCSVCMAAARWHPEAPRQTEQMSSGSSMSGPEHRGVTEHVSPGCSATGPQQSGQIHRRVLTLLKSGVVVPEHSDDEDSPTSNERSNGRRVLSLLNSDEKTHPFASSSCF